MMMSAYMEFCHGGDTCTFRGEARVAAPAINRKIEGIGVQPLELRRAKALTLDSATIA